MSRWQQDTIADELAAAMATAEADARLEQAVYGPDNGDERTIQSTLANALQQRWTVARETPYPSSRQVRLSARLRCDLVLTPPGRPLRADHRPPTLFDAPDHASPEEALWLEVKRAAQFRGPDVRDARYGSQWRQGVVNDLRKMESDPLIREAGLVLVIFAADQAVVEQDLEQMEDRLAVQEVLAGFRQVRHVPIVDRIGHRVCSIALWPTVLR